MLNIKNMAFGKTNCDKKESSRQVGTIVQFVFFGEAEQND